MLMVGHTVSLYLSCREAFAVAGIAGLTEVSAPTETELAIFLYARITVVIFGQVRPM
jgi:hypothetical protein